MASIDGILTADRIKAFCPSVRADIQEALLTEADDAFADAEIDNPVRLAHFMAQIATEAAALKRLDENLYYTTPGRLQKVFKTTKFPTLASEKPYLKNPEGLANYVYANKNGNGNVASGDGYAYRGSGLIQLTGRSNFRTVEKETGIALESNPDLARQPDSAVAIALAYWKSRKINAVADDDSADGVENVTRRINPALVGLKDRQAYYRSARKIFVPPKPLVAGAKAPAAMKAPTAAPPLAPAPPSAELSGPAWVARFPTSRSPDDLTDPFKSGLIAFIAALKAAGAKIKISATYRPKERAYLMHWAWKVGRNGLDPDEVPPMSGVDIIWSHATPAKSRTAAREMVEAYGMVQIAALNGRHIDRKAVDMTISWKGTLSIERQDGTVVAISSMPRTGTNSELVKVGRGYGVIKLVTDPPHWSEDGR